MPPRKRVAGGRKRKAGGRKMLAGKGFFDFVKKAFNGVKSVVDKVAPIVAPIAKTGLIGNAAGYVNPGLGAVVKSVGLGRRRRRVGGRKILAGRGAVTSENVKVLAF